MSVHLHTTAGRSIPLIVAVISGAAAIVMATLAVTLLATGF